MAATQKKICPTERTDETSWTYASVARESAHTIKKKFISGAKEVVLSGVSVGVWSLKDIRIKIAHRYKRENIQLFVKKKKKYSNKVF